MVNIIAAQWVHNGIYRKYLEKTIINYNLLYIICVKDNKTRIKQYKNFLIYLTNHYYLIDMTDEINLLFEKFLRKIEIFL